MKRNRTVACSGRGGWGLLGASREGRGGEGGGDVEGASGGVRRGREGLTLLLPVAGTPREDGPNRGGCEGGCYGQRSGLGPRRGLRRLKRKGSERRARARAGAATEDQAPHPQGVTPHSPISAKGGGGVGYPPVSAHIFPYGSAAQEGGASVASGGRGTGRGRDVPLQASRRPGSSPHSQLTGDFCEMDPLESTTYSITGVRRDAGTRKWGCVPQNVPPLSPLFSIT